MKIIGYIVTFILIYYSVDEEFPLPIRPDNESDILKKIVPVSQSRKQYKVPEWLIIAKLVRYILWDQITQITRQNQNNYKI